MRNLGAESGNEREICGFGSIFGMTLRYGFFCDVDHRRLAAGSNLESVSVGGWPGASLHKGFVRESTRALCGMLAGRSVRFGVLP